MPSSLRGGGGCAPRDNQGGRTPRPPPNPPLVKSQIGRGKVLKKDIIPFLLLKIINISITCIGQEMFENVVIFRNKAGVGIWLVVLKKRIKWKI